MKLLEKLDRKPADFDKSDEPATDPPKYEERSVDVEREFSYTRHGGTLRWMDGDSEYVEWDYTTSENGMLYLGDYVDVTTSAIRSVYPTKKITKSVPHATLKVLDTEERWGERIGYTTREKKRVRVDDGGGE